MMSAYGQNKILSVSNGDRRSFHIQPKQLSGEFNTRYVPTYSANVFLSPDLRIYYFQKLPQASVNTVLAITNFGISITVFQCNTTKCAKNRPLETELARPICLIVWIGGLIITLQHNCWHFPDLKQGEKHNFLALSLTSGCVQPTCEVRVVRGVNEIVREGEGHVFALVQLLRRDDAVLLAVQIPGKAFHRYLTCMETRQRVTINTNEPEQCMCALQKSCAKRDEG